VLYFRRGANMPAANAVRNQLVLLQGRHARHIGEATMITSSRRRPSEPAGPPVRAPQHGDGYAAAVEVLQAYRCWDSMPKP